MPGEPGEKLVKIKDIGTVILADELSALMLEHRAQALPVFEVKRMNGDRYTLAIIDGLGLAVFSHQTTKTFTIEVNPIIRLALEAGVDDGGIIVLPAGVGRG